MRNISCERFCDKLIINPLFPMHLFSTPCNCQKTLRFCDVFRGQRKGALGTNGLKSKVTWNKQPNQNILSVDFRALISVFWCSSSRFSHCGPKTVDKIFWEQKIYCFSNNRSTLFDSNPFSHNSRPSMENLKNRVGNRTKPAFRCSKLTRKTLEQGVKYVQS